MAGMAQKTNTAVEQNFSPLIWQNILLTNTDMRFKPSMQIQIHP